MESPGSRWLRYGVIEGDLVADKYRVGPVIGEGGMGMVVAAHHEQLERPVALKLLPEAAAKDPVLVGRFLREARAASQLQNEHIAKVLDVGTLPTGAPFMVLEYLEGADLGEVLSEGGRLDIPVACDYVRQVCEGIAEAHARGIIHRDLKPENLHLTKRLGGADFIKVLDFGISKVLSTSAAALTTTGATLGSPLYMAPEQLRGARDVGPPADVWALGVVLYELLTRRCPFEADSMPDLCVMITREPPRPLHDHRDDVPEALVDVVARCLQKDPAQRYRDAGELGEALAPFAPSIVGLVVSAPLARKRKTTDSLAMTMAEFPEATPPSASRNGVTPWLAGAVAMAIAAGVWVVRRAPLREDVASAAVVAALSASHFGELRIAPDPNTVTSTAPEPDDDILPILPTHPVQRAMPPPTPARGHPSVSTRPLRSNVPSALPSPDDDIPAFR